MRVTSASGAGSVSDGNPTASLPRRSHSWGKGRSYRLIGRELGQSKNTVADIVKRARLAAEQPCGTR
jgi:hypothetical protein